MIVESLKVLETTFDRTIMCGFREAGKTFCLWFQREGGTEGQCVVFVPCNDKGEPCFGKSYQLSKRPESDNFSDVRKCVPSFCCPPSPPAVFMRAVQKAWPALGK